MCVLWDKMEGCGRIHSTPRICHLRLNRRKSPICEGGFLDAQIQIESEKVIKISLVLRPATLFELDEYFSGALIMKGKGLDDAAKSLQWQNPFIRLLFISSSVVMILAFSFIGKRMFVPVRIFPGRASAREIGALRTRFRSFAEILAVTLAFPEFAGYYMKGDVLQPIGKELQARG